MIINDKEVLTLPEQVLKNKEDIKDLQSAVRYQHNIVASGDLSPSGSFSFYMTLNITDSTPFTRSTFLEFIKENSSISFSVSGHTIDGSLVSATAIGLTYTSNQYKLYIVATGSNTKVIDTDEETFFVTDKVI